MKAVEINENEKIVSKYNKNRQYDYSDPSVLKINVAAYNYFIYHNNPGNCKVCTLSNIQSSLDSNPDKLFERLDELFDNVMKLTFRTTFTNKSSMDKLAKRYPMIACAKIPIGYGSGMQYHCTFMIGNKAYPQYDHYTSRLEKVGVEQGNNTDKVEMPTAPTVKKSKGFNITDEQLEKFRAYKSDLWAKKYINKLVNGEDPQ